jgi:hypothetical protein
MSGLLGRSGRASPAESRREVNSIHVNYLTHGESAVRYARWDITTDKGERCMHGFHASSERELSTEPKSPTRWSSEWNFGLIAVIVLSALAIAAAPLTPIVISP